MIAEGRIYKTAPGPALKAAVVRSEELLPDCFGCPHAKRQADGFTYACDVICNPDRNKRSQPFHLFPCFVKQIAEYNADRGIRPVPNN